MNLNNMFKKVLAFFLVFTLSVPAVEAGSRAKKAHTSRIKKPRAPRVRKVRAPRVRKVRAPRVRKVRTPRIRTQRAPRLTARQQVAIRIAATQEAARIAAVQAEAARIAAIRQRQNDPVRLGVARQHMVNLLTQPLVKAPQQRYFYNAFGVQQLAPYPACDVGYGGSKSRSDIYPNHNVPTAPVFHPYDPTDGLADGAVIFDNYSKPAFTLNVKLLYDPAILPPVIRDLVGNIEPEDIQVRLIAQDPACYDPLVPLQFKPQYGIEPDAPTASPVDYSHLYTVRTGIFSRHHPQVRIQNQPLNGLIEEPGISIHNSGPHTTNVLSDSVLTLENFNRMGPSQIIDSYTEYMDRTGRRKALIGIHLMLDEVDQQLFENFLNASNNLQEVDQFIRAARVGGAGFANIDPDDLF